MRRQTYGTLRKTLRAIAFPVCLMATVLPVGCQQPPALLASRPPDVQLHVTLGAAFMTVYYPDQKILYFYKDNKCQSRIRVTEPGGPLVEEQCVPQAPPGK
jgi:hypothetical protein